jgi:Patatin phospholipase
MVRELVRMMPEAQRETPEVKEIAGYGCGTMMHIIRLNAAPLEHEDYLRETRGHPHTMAGRLCRHPAHLGAQALGSADRSDDGRCRVRLRRRRRDLEH